MNYEETRPASHEEIIQLLKVMDRKSLYEFIGDWPWEELLCLVSDGIITDDEYDAIL